MLVGRELNKRGRLFHACPAQNFSYGELPDRYVVFCHDGLAFGAENEVYELRHGA